MKNLKLLMIGFTAGFLLAVALNTFNHVITVQVQPTVINVLAKL